MAPADALKKMLRRTHRWTVLSILGWLAVAWLSADFYYQQVAKRFYAQELQLVARQAEAMGGSIDERLQLLKGIPVVLSRNDNARLALRRFGAGATPSPQAYPQRKALWSGDARLAELDNALAVAALHLKADVIWIVDAAGDCIAASNAGLPASFVGTNYADRDYFRQAWSGKRGHQYAAGRASKIPGLYYSEPMFEGGRFVGAVVVKRNIDKIAFWTNPAHAFISDANGIIILASDKSLEFRALPDAAVAQLSVKSRLLQYERSRFDVLDIAPWGDVRFPGAVRFDRGSAPALLASGELAEDALRVHVLRPLGELARFNAERDWIFLLLASGGSMLIVAASAILFYLRKLQGAEADLRVAATAFESSEAMMVTDATGVILKVNRAFTGITGHGGAQAIGQKTSMLKSDHHDRAFYGAMRESILSSGAWEGEIWTRRRSGAMFPGWLTVTDVQSADGKTRRSIFILNDITDRKAKEEEIRQLAFYDPLTRLPNRRLLTDRLRLALAAAARSGRYGALLLIDLDNFKTINDTLGHDKGDLLLQQVAERLSGCVRVGDTVARQGGDEFVIMLMDLSGVAREAAMQTELIGEKIIENLNRPYQLAGHVYHNSASIGATLFDGQLESSDEQLKRADLAMYQAKAAGRNTLRFFEADMQAAVTLRAGLETDLRAGLAQQQFLLYYQAQMDGAGRVSGAEALLRWQHPVRGFTPPVEFIPAAEESGLILPLGRWVLETACRQLAAWSGHAATAHLTLAVNVSARQLRQPDFIAQVVELLERSGADPRKLKLELTESMLLDNIEQTIAKMMALKELGVGFSLDDFGTGYSSLSYLKRLPLDQLKIDRSFVRDVLSDPNDAAIVRAIVALAHSLGLGVIAEGVETGAQRDFLAANGCHAYQGYWFSRPLPLAEFEALNLARGGKKP